MTEFDIDNFLDKESENKYPEWLNQDKKNEMIYYDAIVKQSKIIESLIAKNNDSSLPRTMRKITATSLSHAANKKNRSSFSKNRYSKLYDFMVAENTRLNQLWENKVESNTKNGTKAKKIEMKDRVKILEAEVAELNSIVDKKFISKLIDDRRRFRFADLRRTIDNKEKRVEELEMQNAELQMKLRDMIRPIK